MAEDGYDLADFIEENARKKSFSVHTQDGEIKPVKVAVEKRFFTLLDDEERGTRKFVILGRRIEESAKRQSLVLKAEPSFILEQFAKKYPNTEKLNRQVQAHIKCQASLRKYFQGPRDNVVNTRFYLGEASFTPNDLNKILAREASRMDKEQALQISEKISAMSLSGGQRVDLPIFMILQREVDMENTIPIPPVGAYIEHDLRKQGEQQNDIERQYREWTREALFPYSSEANDTEQNTARHQLYTDTTDFINEATESQKEAMKRLVEGAKQFSEETGQILDFNQGNFHLSNSKEDAGLLILDPFHPSIGDKDIPMIAEARNTLVKISKMPEFSPDKITEREKVLLKVVLGYFRAVNTMASELGMEERLEFDFESNPKLENLEAQNELVDRLVQIYKN